MKHDMTLDQIQYNDNQREPYKSTKPFMSFNIWVFIGGPCWFFYHRMFYHALFFSFLGPILFSALWLSPLVPAVIEHLSFAMPINVFCAIYADWMHKEFVQKRRYQGKPELKPSWKFAVLGAGLVASLALGIYVLQTRLEDYKTQQIVKLLDKDGYLSIKLLQRDNVDLHLLESDWDSLVYNAAKNNLVNQLKTFVDRDMDLDKRLSKGLTPLFVAAFYGNVEAAKVLLEQGIDVDGTSTPNESLSPAEKNITPLMVALNNDHFEISQLLIENGANVNYAPVNHASLTPLCFAILKNDVDAVKLLIKSGADVNYVLKTEDALATPLTMAVLSSSLEVVKVLVENKADLHFSDNGSKPLALLAAEAYEKKEMIDYLHAQGIQ